MTSTTCKDSSSCVNEIGSYVCVCQDGFEYVNEKCQSKYLFLKNKSFKHRDKMILLKVYLSLHKIWNC